MRKFALVSLALAVPMSVIASYVLALHAEGLPVTAASVATMAIAAWLLAMAIEAGKRQLAVRRAAASPDQPRA